MEAIRRSQLPKRLAALAAAGSTAIPGVYAWAMTVAPVAWSAAKAPLIAPIAALAGPVFLAAGAVAERRAGRRTSSLCFCGFTLACAVVWASATRPTDPTLYAPQPITGVLAWALFALSWGAPPLKASGESPRVVTRVPRAPDAFPMRAWLLVGLGAAGAMALQMIAWEGAGPERAVLTHLVSVAAGIVLLGASTQLALARANRRRSK
jgi:hypothetical protein